MTLTKLNYTGQGTIPPTKLPTNSVLQVISTTKTDTQTITGSSFVDITGLSATITPSSTSSKILISINVSFSGTIYKESMSGLDSPNTTSATTYKVQISPMRGASTTANVNRSNILGDDNQYNSVSTITLMEIAG